MSNFKVQPNVGGTGTTTLQGNNTSVNLIFVLPITNGTADQNMATDGAGVLSFESDSLPPFQDSSKLSQIQATMLYF